MRRRAARRFPLILVLGIALAQPRIVGSTSEEQLLGVNLEIITQKYCRGEADVWAIQLKLLLHVVNITDRKLIVQKNIGRAWYETAVAGDEGALNEGTYEDNPLSEFVPTDSELHGPAEDALSKEFVLLQPGKSFEGESFVDVLVAVGAPFPRNKGLIRTGSHVLQLKLSTWTYVARPEPFRNKWKEYGELVYQNVKSEPLPFRVPQDSEFKSCKN